MSARPSGTTTSTRPVASPEVSAFLAKTRVPRARATRKLHDVLERLAAGASELAAVREVWAFGSYARGAQQVGDVDLYVLVDEGRSREQFGLDAFYGRGRPYASAIKALGCGGSSFVSVQVQPVFNSLAEPLSPERALTVADPSDPQWSPTQEPILLHIVTDEPLAGPFVLLWARGDRLQWALDRLAGIEEQPDAGRFDRTTSVPLLDDLSHKLSLPVAFMLAAQVRAGNIACEARMLHTAQPPAPTRSALERRYERPGGGGQSPRQLSAAAALAVLEAEGCDLRRVRLVDGPVTTKPLRTPPRISIDFNAFDVYNLAANGAGSDRHLHIWPSGTTGPWLALDLSVVDERAVGELYRHLTSFDLDRAQRAERLKDALGPGR